MLLPRLLSDGVSTNFQYLGWDLHRRRHAGACGANAFGNATYQVPDPADLTVDDSGVVNLNGNELAVSALNSSYSSNPELNGVVTDESSGSGFTSLNDDVGGTPSVFGGSIADTTGGPGVVLNVSAVWDCPGLLFTLTGSISLPSGASFQGIVQVGDGKTSGSISGTVGLGGADDGSALGGELVFNVVSGTTEDFVGSISGSQAGGCALVKTGGGTLDLYGSGDVYSGETAVENGTLQVEYSTALSSTSSVVVDSGATLEFNEPSDYPVGNAISGRARWWSKAATS